MGWVVVLSRRSLSWFLFGTRVDTRVEFADAVALESGSGSSFPESMERNNL